MSIKHLSPNEQASGLATYLIADGLLDSAVAENAIQLAKQEKIYFTSYLVQKNLVSSEDIFNCCCKHFQLPLFKIDTFDPKVLQKISLQLIDYYHVMPLYCDDNTLYLATVDPTNHAALTAISFSVGLTIQLVLIKEDDINDLMNTYCKQQLFPAQITMTLENEQPIIDLVDAFIHEARRNSISDIHIEPFAEHCRIRFRRDGLLYESLTLPTDIYLQVLTRLKMMAKLNITEKRLPQDGRISFSGNQIDIRLSTCPTLFGEKIVLRLLYKQEKTLSLTELGLLERQLNLLLKTLSQPKGLILVTGPTGSGKTLTLYSALQALNKIEKNIISIEDPIEIELPGITQVNINTAIGFDFGKALRTFLRQDPDIIMIGEIRDAETARIAYQAALTGHLVLATLHTSNAFEAIARLQSLHLSTQEIANTLSLIVSQRLLRKLCQHCKQPVTNTIYNLKHTYKAQGCKNCHEGYTGRIGIFELLGFPKNLHTETSVNFLSQIRNQKTTSLQEAAFEHLKAGITSQDELIRVLGNLDDKIFTTALTQFQTKA